jgi:uncharacterized protein (DUF983 family)
MSRPEMHTETDLELARGRQIARLAGRALTLRCPHCGSRGVLHHWLKLQERCPRCGLRLERGEHDYFTGSVLFNFIIAELLFALCFIGYMIAVWPRVNWDVAQYVIVVMILVAPVVTYPVSKLLWLAFDLMLRPVTPKELEWHRASASVFETGRSEERDR